jgi:NIMA (never in mitosis gene a)-related kinase
MPLSDFSRIKLLGKGSYGSVYVNLKYFIFFLRFEVKRIQDGKRYAMKEINMRSMTQKEEEESLNEIRILASFRHVNITKFKEAFINDDKLYIITELVENGDLLVHIKRCKTLRKFFPENTIWSYFIQICQGLAFLHEKNGLFFF